MYKTSRELKAKALKSLKGKWGTAILINIATGLLIAPVANLGGNEGTPGLLSILVNILSVILSVGYTSFLLKICCGQKEQAGFSDLFYGFKCHPGKALLLYLMTVLYLLPGAIIFGIITAVIIIMGISSGGYSLESLLSQDIANFDFSFFGGLIVVLFVCIILYAVYAIYIETKYGIVYLLLLDYPDLSVSQIWKRSGQLMKGSKWRMFRLTLSFWPIIIAGIVAVSILASISQAIAVIGFVIYFVVMFAVTIHMSTAKVEFYLDLINQQPRNTYTTTAPTQTTDYSNPSAGAPLTHDCEDTHGNSFEKQGNDYSGIDLGSFK